MKDWRHLERAELESGQRKVLIVDDDQEVTRPAGHKWWAVPRSLLQGGRSIPLQRDLSRASKSLHPAGEYFAASCAIDQRVFLAHFSTRTEVDVILGTAIEACEEERAAEAFCPREFPPGQLDRDEPPREEFPKDEAIVSPASWDYGSGRRVTRSSWRQSDRWFLVFLALCVTLGFLLLVAFLTLARTSGRAAHHARHAIEVAAA
jgi:hypothetical protein